MNRFTRRNGVTRRDEVVQLREQLRLVEEELARVRLERQRPASALEAAYVLVESLPGDGERSESDHADEVWHVHAETAVMVDSLVVACEALRACVDQVQRQLTAMRPAPEIDRRAKPHSGAVRHTQHGPELVRDVRSVELEEAR